MSWFITTSYQYISPKGLRGHIGFLLKLPLLAIRFHQEAREFRKGMTG